VAGGAATVLGGGVLGPTTALAQTTCVGLDAIEAYPTSPLILEPFRDPLPVPKALAPVPEAEVGTRWASAPGPGVGQQDSDGGTHQLWCETLGYGKPHVYDIRLQVARHSFSSSPVRNMVSYRNSAGQLVPAGTVVSRLPDSTIYGFNGTFPGPMINAEYGKSCLVRFQNYLHENPENLDRQDFGAPDWAFLTHLHNGHTAAESDGNPHHREQAYRPGEWCDNLYLNYPAGNNPHEKQSFFWFHDHRLDHTGANVYKGMVGLFPLYDPVLDPGDETRGLRLPGVRTDNPDGSFDVAYDIPLVFYDCRLDDGVVPHQDFHDGCGESHPEWWGKTYFRHFPNSGFVGDVFTTNCTAYPVLRVKRRKYRFRMLSASISRCYDITFMSSRSAPRSAISMRYSGDELQGQWRLPEGQQCLKMTQIASEGGLLPYPLERDSIEVWPAKRREVVVDFTKYMDGTPTKDGDVIYVVNRMKMRNGRKPDSFDSKYKIPMVKIVIEGNELAADSSVMPVPGPSGTPLRPCPDISGWASWPRRSFELQRGGGSGGEIQWLINDHPFDPTVPLATVQSGAAEVWMIRNGGGGWTHPMHLHMEEHQVVQRNGRPTPADPRHVDDIAKEDVIALDPGEEVWVARRFRTFTGRYVAHCHNLAHEDHAMMFGWSIV
jgi:FtsP/CotA-like multicopper oxidase with cupredoxin domain